MVREILQKMILGYDIVKFLIFFVAGATQAAGIPAPFLAAHASAFFLRCPLFREYGWHFYQSNALQASSMMLTFFIILGIMSLS